VIEMRGSIIEPLSRCCYGAAAEQAPGPKGRLPLSKSIEGLLIGGQDG
jgi:hypothetical protein